MTGPITPGNPTLGHDSTQQTIEVRLREKRTLELVLAGKSYREAAEQVGYTHKATAWKAVQRLLAREEAEAVADLRAVEGARLDKLQAAFWEKALEGDEPAARVLIRIFQQRARLFGLNAPVVIQSGVPSEVDDEIQKLVGQINAAAGTAPIPTE